MAIKLNIGCGGRLLTGYINIDQDSLETLKKRYPYQTFADDLEVFDYDIFNLPYENGMVSEVKADGFIEHLSFSQEKAFFLEVQRVLSSDGLFEFSTPDFEDAVKKWLEAKDDWKDFYRDDEEAIRNQHWFGTYTYDTANRWGYLMAMIFGSQNGEGQYHKNAYSEGKIRSMMNRLGFEIVELSRFKWKGGRDLMIKTIARKI